MNITCPNCHLEDAYLDIVDEGGAHYICPNCDHNWVDPEHAVDESEKNTASFIDLPPSLAMHLKNTVQKPTEKKG